MEGDKITCKKVELTKGITKIKASSNKRGSGVNNVQYEYANKKEKFGSKKNELDKDKNAREWSFTDDKPLIGLYGRATDGVGINQLGFITLDVECQSAIEAEKAEWEKTEEEKANAPFSEAHSGLDRATFFIIGGGVIVFVAVLVTARWF